MQYRSAKLVMNGHTQLVQMPKDFHLEDVAEIRVCRVGNKYYVEPLHEWLFDDYILEQTTMDEIQENILDNTLL